jgi:hypothetical protein
VTPIARIVPMIPSCLRSLIHAQPAITERKPSAMAESSGFSFMPMSCGAVKVIM